MGFLLKKIISMFLMPLPLGVAFIVLGLILLYRNQLKKAKFVLLFSIAWFFLFSYTPFVNALLAPLESKYSTLHQAPKEVKYIYVLGGGHSTDETLPITSQVHEASVIRLNEGIRLYQQLDKNAKIIVSGHRSFFDSTPHAVIQEKLALSLGVRKEDIILRSNPRDTQEEARAAKKLLGNSPFILVTSASHMARAMKFFTQEGLAPIPAPTNHLVSIKQSDFLDFFSSRTFEKSRILFHEFLGMIWQKLKGI